MAGLKCNKFIKLLLARQTLFVLIVMASEEIHQILLDKIYFLAKSVCEITFETWADTLSGHNKIYTDTSGVVWTSC